MSFRAKIAVLLFIVAVVPTTVSGFMSYRSNENEMVERIDEYQQKSAKLMADSVNNFFKEAVNSIRLSVKLIPFSEFPKEDLSDAVKIPYHQFDFINIAVLLSNKGEQLAHPAFDTFGENQEQGYNKESVTAQDIKTFGKNIPFSAAINNGTAFGPVYFCKRSNTPRIALAVAIPTQNGDRDWVFAVELSLKRILDIVTESMPSQGTLFLVSSTKNLIFHSDANIMKTRSSFKNPPVVSDGFKQKSVISTRYIADEEMEIAGTFAWIPILNWGLVTEQPVKNAFQIVYRIRDYTLFWIALGIMVAVFGGTVLSRGLSEPLLDLTKSAKDIAKGRFDHPIEIKSNDEIGQLAQTFNHMSSELKSLIGRYEELFISSIHTIVKTVEAKDKYTRGHSERVTYFALALSELMELEEHDREIVELAGLLHDVGKIGVPEEVLNKKGRLTDEEFDIIKSHSVQGAKIVQKIKHADVFEVVAIVRAHHERWDGKGYPDGLKGEESPLVARILTVVDAYDAMTSDRAYRKGMDVEQALEQLDKGAGSQFDKEIVKVFYNAVEKGLFSEMKEIGISKYVVSDIPSPAYSQSVNNSIDVGQK